MRLKKPVDLLIFFGFVVFLIIQSVRLIGGDGGFEISNQKKKISCHYIGMAEIKDRTVLKLVFKNKTGKDILEFMGKIRIMSADSDTLQESVINWNQYFRKGSAKAIPIFRFDPLQDQSKEIIQKQSENPPIHFILKRILFQNGKTKEFSDE